MKNAFLLALALVVIGLVAALFILKRSYPPEGEQFLLLQTDLSNYD
jgi:hypothetical protein